MPVTHALATPSVSRARERPDLIRKITWRLIPYLGFIYLIAYIDRQNVSYAKLQMVGDLGLSEYAYGLGASLFFIGYFLFEVPSNVFLEKVGARIWFARIMIPWGIVTILLALTNSTAMFYILRFPWVIVAVALWVIPARASVTGKQTPYIVGPALFGAVCLVASVYVPGNALKFAFLCGAAAGIFAGQPVLWSLPSSFLSGAGAAAGLAAINSVGNLSGFIAQNVVPWIRDQTGSNEAPMLFLAACLTVGGLMTFWVQALIRRKRSNAGIALESVAAH
jgi:MFS family permease